MILATNHLPRLPVRLLISTVLLFLIASGPLAVAAQDVPELQVNSKRYIVLDADSGEIYVQKNADEQVAIASLTKVFTAVQALEMASLDLVITTDESDMVDRSNNTYMGFGVGETYTLQDMIYGMMLPSGNDAAHAVARSLGFQAGDTPQQSVDRYMSWVNQRIKDIGLTNTHLLNPTGWGVEGHYSTAHDVAAFVRYALTFPDLVDAMGTRSYTTSNGYLTVTNTNRLLSDYELLDGGKTGFDFDSGYCLIEFASLDDTTMISVTLDGIAPGDWYDDNRVLLNYAFSAKADMIATDQPFEGSVASYLDPAAAELARSAQVGGSFASQGSDVSASISDPAPDVVPDIVDAPEPERSVASRIGDQGVWVAVGTVLSLVLLRGVWAFRRQGHDDPPAII
ncbi:MAG: D-alanyl-D-alanine carboxypeptidase [Thermomicrobiales bacterium]